MKRLVVCASVLLACADPGEEVSLGSAAAAVAVTWTNAVGVSPAGNDLSKTGADAAWDAGAVSLETLTGDGYVQFTTDEATTTKMAGLSVGDASQHYADIDFAIHLKATGRVGVYEGGVLRGSNFTGYLAGDVFRVEAKAGVVTYSKNGGVFYTSAAAPGSPLLVDTSLFTPGATINDVELVATSLTWQNAVGVSATGNDLTKTGGQSQWNAGASSVETLSGDGLVEFTTGESTTNKMAGLGNGDASQHYADIEYAVWLKANGTVGVYEGGVLRDGNLATYLAGDVFRVEVAGGVVRYSMNGGPVLYTSAVAASLPLGVDTSLLTVGGTINDVRLVAAADACPEFRPGGPVCGGNFVVNNSFDLAEIAGCAEITGSLTIDAPGMPVVALPALERVGGDLTIVGNVDLQRLRFPELKQVGDTVVANLTANTTGFDLSRLKTAAISFSDSGPDFALPCLESAASFTAYDLAIPRLRTVTGSVGGRVFAPALETAGAIGNGAVSAPILTTVTGNATGHPFDAPNLTEVGGTLDYWDDTETPALARAGSVIFRVPTAVDLPLLVEVTGPLSGGSYLPSGECAFSLIPLEVLSLPALERAGAVSLCWNALAEVHLPALQEITGPPLGTIGLRIGAASAVAPLEFPALVTIRGGVFMQSDVWFHVLELVRGKVTLLDYQFAAPGLTEVQGHVFAELDVTAISLPSLASAYSLVVGRTRSDVQSIDLPALTTLGGGGGAQAGKFEIRNPHLLTSLSLPSLQSTSGAFSINSGDLLATIDFPSLTQVGPLFRVTNNPALPTCQAEEIRDQLLEAGWTGTITISGNDDGGTCP